MKLFPSSKIKQISAIEAEPLIERGEVVIVDVRRPQDYEESHVEGAILADKTKSMRQSIPTSKTKPSFVIATWAFQAEPPSKI